MFEGMPITIMYQSNTPTTSNIPSVLPPNDDTFVFVNDGFPKPSNNPNLSNSSVSTSLLHDGTTSPPTKPTRRSGKKKSGKAPRPQNAFMIYRREKHSAVVAENKDLHNKEVSRIVGRYWRAESEEVRRSYERKADFAKLEHLVKYPGYKYEPKKSRKPLKKKSTKLPTPAVPTELGSSKYARGQAISCQM
ncbi:high mobility group box domain-containing protein [Jimgerdemannia flammicorona]|uniref:High mobility group box domain-containing protein n=1 Tax=Jimgerdemannia flammicorona TaxID=994334 RepID=A0A433QZB5_9FUNG|nr:high mobility group box domain-containing protein [Jimgerdemannia flammicorona]